MEHQKLLNLLNKASDSKFVTRKWNIINDQSISNFDVWNKIIYTTEVLNSNHCNYNDPASLVRGGIAVAQLLQNKYHLKVVCHLWNVSLKLMEQQQMILKI